MPSPRRAVVFASSCSRRKNPARPTPAPSTRISFSRSGRTWRRSASSNSMSTQRPVLDRFLRYVTYDTQSREGADSYPSTPGQLVLLRDLAAELRAMGVADAAVDEYGY